MHYVDRVYGPVVLDEPVLVDLVDSRAMGRLRGVLQHGISAIVGVTAPVSRFEHSMGVMLLVRRLGADLNEQIAALLHDVSHTAFSHVVDYVFDGHDSQSYHEEIKADFLAGTDIPALLAAYDLDWHAFLDETRYPLLEQDAPALCADRLDYFLRDGVDLGVLSEAERATILAHLTVHGGRIMVDGDLDAARLLAYRYIEADRASWANYWEVGLYELTARAIQAAMQRGVLTEADLWRTDDHAWGKLQASHDPELRRWLDLVTAETQFERDEAEADFRVSTKLRTIDPDVVVAGGSLTLSALDAEFAAFRAAYLRDNGGKWPYRIVPANNAKLYGDGGAG
ncbi:MAG: HD domain-containing protein [Anaerolineae bacterium]|nr:HD domain-containing protein [Anaerolineae bacterium]